MKYTTILINFIAIFILSSGCGGGDDLGEDPASLLSAADDWGCWIKGPSLTDISSTEYDIMVIDPTYDGRDSSRFSRSELDKIRFEPDGDRRLLIAYISIGEAENYRDYWNDLWDADGNGVPDDGAPSWLGPANQDWQGNYKVKYWEDGWQEIVLSEVEKIIEAGFDGIYMDIIDAYWYWTERIEEGEDVGSDDPACDMVEFVLEIAGHGRQRSPEGFLIIPQNGEYIRWDGEDCWSDYIDIIDAIGVEDLFYDEHGRSYDDREERVSLLKEEYLGNGKKVLSIDYPPDTKIETYYEEASAEGFIPYGSFTDRQLDGLRPPPEGYEPD